MLAWMIADLEQPDDLCKELRARRPPSRLWCCDRPVRPGWFGLDLDVPAHSGDRFTSEMEEAWLEAYAFISSEMERDSPDAAPTGA